MKPHLFDSISGFLRTLVLPKPLHPLVNIVERVQLGGYRDKLPDSFLLIFISYLLKQTRQAK